eukprot:1977913-Amphidinium_carterae.1
MKKSTADKLLMGAVDRENNNANWVAFVAGPIKKKRWRIVGRAKSCVDLALSVEVGECFCVCHKFYQPAPEKNKYAKNDRTGDWKIMSVHG